MVLELGFFYEWGNSIILMISSSSLDFTLFIYCKTVYLKESLTHVQSQYENSESLVKRIMAEWFYF